MVLKIACWLFLCIIAYAYLGYTLVLICVVLLNRIFRRKESSPYDGEFEPDVSLVIPAYNEAECIEAKIKNCRELDYPRDKLHIFFVTDGSVDGTREVIDRHQDMHLLHEADRKGKVHAINRCMKQVKSPVVIFSDANAMLNASSIRKMVRFLSDAKVGCVAGEKRIISAARQKAVSAGEGLYWKYESLIKSLESSTGSVLGAAGELFAIRRDLYTDVPEDLLLDDFAISMNIASKGYQVKYTPEAWSYESSSYDIPDELHRKIRIAAGGLQFLFRMPALLNPFRFGLLTFKYISHKVLRWTLVPFGFLILLLTDIAIVAFLSEPGGFYAALLFLQGFFYTMVLAGMALKNTRTGIKSFFVPYYLVMMNYAIVVGICRYIKGNFTTRWPKARRAG